MVLNFSEFYMPGIARWKSIFTGPFPGTIPKSYLPVPMSLKSTSVTIKEIAKMLGLSKSTVSRALTEHSDVGEETRKKILSLAQKLQYEPNQIALSLKQQCTKTLGVIVPETVNIFFSKVIGGIQKVATDSGYNVLVCQSNECYQNEKNNIRSLISHHVDGLLISVSRETDNSAHLNILMEKKIPVVFFDRIMENFSASHVYTDNYEISYQATRHLIDQGCRRIAVVAGPQHLYHSKKRFEGYKDALLHHDMEIVEDYVVPDRDLQKGNIEGCTRHLLQRPSPPDAVMAVNDMAAIEMMHVIKKYGLKIPSDIAVIGFNNESVGQFVEPSLSTVDLPAYEMGIAAAEVLLGHLKKENQEPQQRLIKSTLIVRESTSIKKNQTSSLSI